MGRLKPIIFTLLILLIVISGLWMVLNSDNAEEQFIQLPVDADERATIEASETDSKIRIAVICALTGDAAQSNSVQLTAVGYAAKQINDLGGINGRFIEVIPLDNESTSLGARDAAQEAVRRQVNAVIGPARSSFALAVAPVLQENGIPMLTPSATNPKVTRVGNYIFRMCFTDDFQGVIVASHAIHNLGVKTAMTLVDTNRVYSTDLGKIFHAHFESLGGQVLGTEGYLSDTNDFSNILSVIQQKRPQMIFVPGESREVGHLMRQAGGLKLDCRFIGSDSWNNEELIRFAGEHAEGGQFVSIWHRGMKTEANQTFIKRYENAHGRINSAMIPLSYDACHLISQAMKSFKGEFTAEQLRNAIAQIEFEGVSGRIRFDKDGNPINRPAVILTLDKAEARFLQTVYPDQKPASPLEAE